jgi:dTDP-4-amino-4,6-dideoxygalactose transaminase
MTSQSKGSLPDRDSSTNVFHQYTIRARNRDRSQQNLKENGIDIMVYYPKPLHQQPVFAELGYAEEA